MFQTRCEEETDNRAGCLVIGRRKSECRRSIPCGRSGRMTDEVLKELSAKFTELYATTGRPSIAGEKLLRALPLKMARRPQLCEDLR
jgi:hypothetical protein